MYLVGVSCAAVSMPRVLWLAVDCMRGLTINWDVGAGYNEFNKEEGIMRIFRYGFPGKNRRINLVSNLADVQAVRVEIRDGVNPQARSGQKAKHESHQKSFFCEGLPSLFPHDHQDKRHALRHLQSSRKRCSRDFNSRSHFLSRAFLFFFVTRRARFTIQGVFTVVHV